ncbi:MAG TPA: hypothetical protein VHM92_11450 [Allosphingosinicella sp.]|nr:hypothetical protein [Allosphingosinicella sp.]
MTTSVETLPAWSAADQAQRQAMGAASAILRDADFSDDPSSPYQQAEQACQRLAEAGKRLAVARMKRIDAAIAASGQVAEITAAANKAKKEADLIATATAKVEKLTQVVTAVTQIATKITALPFV